MKKIIVTTVLFLGCLSTQGSNGVIQQQEQRSQVDVFRDGVKLQIEGWLDMIESDLIKLENPTPFKSRSDHPSGDIAKRVELSATLSSAQLIQIRENVRATADSVSALILRYKKIQFLNR